MYGQSYSEVDDRRAEEALRFARNLRADLNRKLAFCIIAAITFAFVLFVGAAFGTRWYKHGPGRVVHSPANPFEEKPPPISKNDSATGEGINSTAKQAIEWLQPSSPARPLTYSARFSSSSAMREMFGELPGQASNVETLEALSVKTTFEWWPKYPRDYCDFCNCSIWDPNDWRWFFGEQSEEPETGKDEHVRVGYETTPSRGGGENTGGGAGETTDEGGAGETDEGKEWNAANSGGGMGNSEKDNPDMDSGFSPPESEPEAGGDPHGEEQSTPPPQKRTKGESRTNNQVEDVDESDIIKTDGEYVYILPRGEQVLVIATAYPFDAVSVVSSTNLTRFNMEPSEMLLDGSSLVIIGTARVKSTSAGISSVNLVSVQLWDISDQARPSLTQTQEVEGNFNTARLINGFVYVVIQTDPYVNGLFETAAARAFTVGRQAYSVDPATKQMPSATRSESSKNTDQPRSVQQRVHLSAQRETGASSSTHERSMKRLAPLARFLVGNEADIEVKSGVPLTPITECSKISSVEGLGVADSWLTILSVATQGTGSVSVGAVESMTHAGRGGNVFVSTDNVYVAATNYDYFLPANREATGQLPRDGVWTGVLKFGIAEGKASFKQLMEVPGSVLNQFSMDEHEGHFRIATTYGDMWGAGNSVSNVFIFDAAGAQTGKVTGLAPGERIFSARFQGVRCGLLTWRACSGQGDTGYIVTFRQVDPLFVLDLSNPASPRVLGELKIPGWSDYLHPVNATHLIGLGKAASAEGVVEGVKVALFDVSDPTAPKEQYLLSLGDRGSDSEATWDHKAFLFHARSGLLVFPITLREIPDKDSKSDEELRWAWGEVVVDGAVVLHLGEEGFEQRGYVSHMAEPPSADNWWGHGVRKIYRAGFMFDGDDEQVLFSYSQRELRVHDVSNLAAPISQVQLSGPECVASASEAPAWSL